LTYAQALKLLVRDDERIKLLDRILGGALLAAAPVTGGASLALLDPKTEVIGWLRDLTGTAPARIKAARGKEHYELLEATHTVLALSAFFDAFRDEVGPGYADLELTDAEKLHTADLPSAGGKALPDGLRSTTLAMPSAMRGFVENLAEVGTGFGRLFDSIIAFVQGLSEWERVRPRVPNAELQKQVAERALGYYRDRFVRLAADLPEFAFLMEVNEHAATRAAVEDATERIVQSQSGALEELRSLLVKTVSFVGQAPAVEAKLTRHATGVLDQPLWRAEQDLLGLVFPTVRAGFVSPLFRLAVADRHSQPADESWWSAHPDRTDLAAFLAQHLATPESTQRPLVLLGHPGAGKTLLAEVIAAQLPATAYTTILVRLRRVDADADLHQQIESAIESAAREHVSWGRLCRESRTTKVVIFDGFDELVQATGVTQSGYLEKIARFQREEWADGNSVVPIITSRTLVMDRVRIPDGTVLAKLEEFADEQVEHWVQEWNRANIENPSFRPLLSTEMLRQGELARQPLLLTLLAIYAAERHVGRLDTENLSKAELYRRLLDTFIARQVRDKAKRELGETEQRRLEADLRRDLAVAAFAMFNRGRQFVTENEVDRDLNALPPTEAPAERTGFGEPVGRARRAAAAFFFIHVAHADEHDETKALQTYEFLHASFGEYLIAERTVALLSELAEDMTHARERAFGRLPDHAVFRALLVHQPLLKRPPIVDFVAALTHESGHPTEALRQAVAELLANSRARGSVDGIDEYQPTAFDPVRRLAAYTANLVTLAAAVAPPEGVPVAELSRGTDWESTVRLWRAGLDAEGQYSVLSRLSRDEHDLVAIHKQPLPQAVELSTAQLVADGLTEAYLEAGMRSWSHEPKPTAFQRKFHTELVGLMTTRWPVPSLRYLTFWDQRKYQQLLNLVTTGREPVSASSALQLLQCLAYDGPWLPPELVTGLYRAALSGLKADLEHPVVPPFIPEVLARCPYLVDDSLDIARMISPDHHPSSLLAAVLASRSLAQMPADRHAHFEQLTYELERRVTDKPVQYDPSWEGVLSAEVVEEAARRGLPEAAVLHLFRALRGFAALAWRQIRPGIIAALVADPADLAPGAAAELTEILSEYLKAHGLTSQPDGLAEVRAELVRLEVEPSHDDQL
jgi:hypothetical protein